MNSEPDEMEVYLSLCLIFWGPHSEIRKKKKIESRLRLFQQPYADNPEVAALIEKYQFEPVVAVCKRLLREGVFASRQAASARFSGFKHLTFQTPTTERGETENGTEVVASVTRAVADISSNTMAETQSYDNWIECLAWIHTFDYSPEADTTVETSHCQSPESKRVTNDLPNEKPWDAAGINTGAQEAPSAAAPSPQIRAESVQSASSHPQINPACLSYQAQHILLVRAQEILENACFKYAVHNMPQTLRDRRWDVPECSELHVWARMLKHDAETRFKDEEVPLPYPSWDSFFQSIADLRHKAVHRERLEGSDVESYLRDAQNLARLLRDGEGAETLARFRDETGQCLKTFEFCKKKISRKFQATMDAIHARRAELDRLEEQAMRDLVQEDETIQAKLGSDLKEAIVNLEVAQAKEVKEITDEHEERKMSGGLIASLRYLGMSYRRLYRGGGGNT